MNDWTETSRESWTVYKMWNYALEKTSANCFGGQIIRVNQQVCWLLSDFRYAVPDIDIYLNDTVKWSVTVLSFMSKDEQKLISTSSFHS